VTLSINRHSLAATGLSIVAAVMLSACGGGGGGGVGTTPPVTASPSSSPTNSPSVPQSSTSSIAFQSGTAQTFTIKETGYSGAFTESDTCNPLTGQIASVTAVSNTGGAASYQVAPIAAGACTVTITDASSRSATISVSVATAAITVQ